MKSIPQASFLESVKTARSFKRGDISATMSLGEKYGEIVYLPFPISAYLIAGSSLIEDVLIHRQRDFRKSNNYHEMKYVMGEGLVTAEGETWAAQRKNIASAFRLDVLDAYAPRIVGHIERMSEKWRHLDKPIDIAVEIGDLISRISTDILFGPDAVELCINLQEPIRVAAERVVERIYSPWAPPRTWPTPANRRERRAHQEINLTLTKLIESHKKNPPTIPTIIGALDSTQGNSTTSLRDQLVTLMLAGQDTVSAALSWFFLRIADDRSIQESLYEEVRAQRVAPSYRSLVELPVSNASFNETLRLHPPIPVVARTPVRTTQVGGYSLPLNSIVLLSIYALHRNRQYWPDAERFLPTRFLRNDAPSRNTFIPYASGPRKCIGDRLATLEAMLIISTLLRRFRFQRESDEPIRSHTTITMIPQGNLRLHIEPR